MRVPKVIYESYPWLYVSGGAAAVSIGTDSLALLSGLLLLVSGVAILLLRRNYRISQQVVHQLQT
ncbi:MAG: hypothetical protein HY080_03385 [Gammaproteobacteria bacterium]|nr:hypothetical protein [Gammaproteobacteria bacterium]